MLAKFIKEPELTVILILIFFLFWVCVLTGEKLLKNRNKSTKSEVAEELRTEYKIEEAGKIEKTHAESPEK